MIFIQHFGFAINKINTFQRLLKWDLAYIRTIKLLKMQGGQSSMDHIIMAL